MLLSFRPQIGALLLAAALLPHPEAVAADLHPLDPDAPTGVVPTQNAFEALVPLLDRDGPLPSFAGEAPDATEGVSDQGVPVDLTGANQETMSHGTMDHGAPAAGGLE